METLDKLAYNVLNHLVGSRSTNSETISLDQIKYNILHYRSLFIRRDIRNDDDAYSFQQTFSLNVETVESPFSTENETIYVTTNTLPAILRLKHRYPIDIYDVTTKSVIPMLPSSGRHFLRYNKFIGHTSRSIILDNKIYVTKIHNVNTPLTVIEIRAILEDPTDGFILAGISPLDIGTAEFPISGDMASRITEGLIKGTLPFMLQTPQDTVTDLLPATKTG